MKQSEAHAENWYHTMDDYKRVWHANRSVHQMKMVHGVLFITHNDGKIVQCVQFTTLRRIKGRPIHESIQRTFGERCSCRWVTRMVTKRSEIVCMAGCSVCRSVSSILLRTVFALLVIVSGGGRYCLHRHPASRFSCC